MGSVTNPYAAPAARVEDYSANPEAEAIRKAHISHEASIKAVGILYYLGGALVLVSAFVSLEAVRVGASPVWLLLGLLLAAVGQLFAGWGVRGFRRWGRVVGCVLSAIGLLGFPVGTLINGYILYLFLSKKGRTIFSAEYQDVIAATPHIKYRTSIIVWIFFGLVVLLVAAAIIVPLFK
jgi:hypothetical protein